MADEIVTALQPKLPERMALGVEHSEHMSRVVLRHRDYEPPGRPVALVDKGGICLRGPNGTLLGAARSIRKLERVIAKLEQSLPGEVAWLDKALAVDVAWEFSADVTERLRRFRALGPDDDGPAPPLTIGSHLDNTDIHIRVPNARIGAIATQLEAQLKAS